MCIWLELKNPSLSQIHVESEPGSESVPLLVPPESDVAAADSVSASFRYLNAIQTMCPHILRYLTTAVITNKDVRKRRQVLKDLVKVIQQVRLVSGVADYC